MRGWGCGQWGSRRRLIACLLGLLLVLGPGALPAGAQDEVALEIREIGWDGTLVPYTWSPIRVRATGGRQDVDGRLEVHLKNRADQPGLAYGQDLLLPAGTTKEAVIWVPIGTTLLGQVQYVSSGRLLAAEPFKSGSYHTSAWPLVGVLADAPAVARRVGQLASSDPGTSRQLWVALLRAAELPVEPDRLGALSALVVQGNAAVALSGEQRRAIHDWVAAGGHLLLAGALRAPRPAAVLPSGTLAVSSLGVDSAADLTGLAVWAGQAVPPSAGPLARFQADGAPLAGSPERPLAWRFTLGRGTITLLPVDLELEPLASWVGTPAVLQQALEPALPRPGEDERQRSALLQARSPGQRLASAVEALPPEAYPSWSLAALLLGGFAVAVGPLLHLVLARLDRRGWVWVLVPGAALALSAAMYVLGIGRDGRDVLGNVVTYVRLEPDGSGASQSVAAGFFAPVHQRLTVTVPGDTLVRAGSLADDSRFPPGSGPRPPATSAVEPLVRVRGGPNTQVDFDTSQWSMRKVSFERSLGPEVGRINAQLERAGSLVRGRLRNETPYDLENAAVVQGESVYRLGDLAPGQVADVELPTGGNGSRGFPSVSGRVVGGPPGPTSATSSASSPSGAEAQRRARLLDAALELGRSGPNVPPIPLTFVAFTRAPVGADFPHVGGRPTYHLTLLAQPLRAEPAP